jgi:hypothetical protein
VCAVAAIPGTALAAYAIFFARGDVAIIGALIAAQIFLWMHSAPANALIVNSLDLASRARAFGFAIFLTHALGDVISPPLIGAVSERTGSVASGIGVALVALLLASALFAVGARLPERARA